MQEVEADIMYAENTASGLDEIPLAVMKKVWPIYCEEITSLFQWCLKKDYYLLIFKNALLYIPLKLGKRCQVLPRSYQLIALLLYLSKWLEKAIAKKLNNIILKLQLISLLYFGAIARCFAVDAATTLTHDIKKYFQSQKILTALAFDIKRAFNKVINYRFIQRL